jgi:hypothetical protein
MTSGRAPAEDAPPRHPLLGIYLNDHLAGATAGLELAHRTARAHQHRAENGDLRRIANEISQDRAALRQIMAALGIAVRRYKTTAAWIGEKAGRLKLNGRIRSRSPLSDLEELEMLRLSAEGKAAGWRTLRVLADSDQRLDATRLDDLIARAQRQADRLEELRVRAARRVTGPDDAG